MRRVAFAIVVLVMMSNVAVGVHTSVMDFDDFEDGDISGWSDGSISSTSINGDHSLRVSSNDQSSWTAGPTLPNNGHHYIRGTFRVDSPNSGVAYTSVQVDSSSGFYYLRVDPAAPRFQLSARDDSVGSNNVQDFGSTNYDTWYGFNISVDGSTIRAKTWPASQSEPSSFDASVNNVQDWSGGTVQYRANDDVDSGYLDDIGVNTGIGDNQVSGYVKDIDGDPIESATVELDGTSTTTDASGSYSVRLPDGTYTMNASADGYVTNTSARTVTVSGSDVENQNATLRVDEDVFVLDVPDRMKRNETAAYSVSYDGSDVTSSATVQSDDTSVLVVDQSNEQLEAQDAAGAPVVNATYTNPDGNELEVNETVPVYDDTLRDIGIVIGDSDGETVDGEAIVSGPDLLFLVVTDWTFMFLFICGLVSAVVCRVAGNDEFVCLGISSTLVVALWLFGLVPLYLMVTALLSVGAILFKT